MAGASRKRPTDILKKVGGLKHPAILPHDRSLRIASACRGAVLVRAMPDAENRRTPRYCWARRKE